jgi:hypothetical protein
MDSDSSKQQEPDTNNVQAPHTPPHDVRNGNVSPANSVFLTIKHITAWVMIISAILFALIGVLAVWEVLGTNAGDVVWRAFISMVIIAFASLVVNVASRIAMNNK